MNRSLIQSSVLYRDLGRAYPTIVRGEGVYLWDTEGRRYIDGSGGSSAVTSIGHGVQEIADAMAAQARKVAFVPMHLFTSEPLEALAEAIAKFAPADLNRVWFVSGGSEATENAAKIARQYWLERGKPSKSIVIGRWQSFHGNTMGSMAFGGHTIRRRKYVPMFNEASHLPPMYCYRCHFKQTYPSCDTYCADYLERLVRMQGPENVAAFIAEPVVGATLGAVPARARVLPEDPGDLRPQRDPLHRRRGDDGIRPDGGELRGRPLGRRPRRDRHGQGGLRRLHPAGRRHRPGRDRPGLRARRLDFVAGHTYSGHPLAAAVGLAVLRTSRSTTSCATLARSARDLLAGLRGLQARHPIIGDVRGLGMMVGLEFVADRATRAPFPVEREVARGSRWRRCRGAS